ncbi:hypothetical protein AU490_08760 [Lonsdalea populi]|uniref:Uncharacterized protein n=2 Tax=Lonsdalea TaxID=1082702 RepID=A0ACD1JC54_9GAMM|nr:hypothetical protein AU485_09405 [Lonsdalea quercina]RAT18693.1 hypothetical protein AU487_13510 [Lonsdalea populi]RAT15879.1 hypothetical protein AU486_09060 [Lonsdalea quercina]RAT21538.1 hypothetical protein AU489_14420 [Lonsdalea populi]RAT22400.1 hypothetical protein AU488_11215 [Lonsdalea populi]
MRPIPRRHDEKPVAGDAFRRIKRLYKEIRRLTEFIADTDSGHAMPFLPGMFWPPQSSPSSSILCLLFSLPAPLVQHFTVNA